MARWLGIDLGTRRIGVAISDGKGLVATPYAVLDRTSDERDATAIREIAAAEGARQVVLGHPLSLDGTAGHSAMVAEGFAEKLKEMGVKVKLWDERFTTVEAEKRLKSGGAGGKRRRAVVDKVAAAVLLQAFLDARGG
ncbi:MAG: Holliday junction resolvase RuvX [Actinomycetota bacterium]